MGIEELLNMPPLGKIPSQRLDFVAVRCREERLEVMLLGPLSLPLNVLVKRSRLAVPGSVRNWCQFGF
jgi:hypothetical protein